MNRLCTICARGGSKGVPGKNIRSLAGLPVIAHSIAQARASGLFDFIAVSSDCAAIRETALAHGADLAIARPEELATDTAAKLPVIRHAVLAAEARCGMQFDTLVDLDATSPLRSVDDVRQAVILLESTGSGNVITAMPARRSPYFNMVEVGGDGIVALSKQLDAAVVRRQDAPACFDMNASIYVWQRDKLFEQPGLFNADTRLYVMPEERSYDIDSEIDFLLVELLMKRAQAEI